MCSSCRCGDWYSVLGKVVMADTIPQTTEVYNKKRHK